MFRTFTVATANLDAAAHAAGDTLFIPVAVSALQRGFRNSSKGILRSLVYSISAAVDVAPVIYLLDQNITLGAPNAAFGLTFADSSKVIGRLNGGTVVAVGAGRQWTFPAANDAMNIPLRSLSNGNIFIAAATTGTPTPGASCTSQVTLTVEYA